jgi:LacI family transcriptional regulator
VERRISPRTVARVEAAARTLGYVPNITARRLRSHTVGTSQAVLAVITSFETPLLLVSRAASALQRLIERDGAGYTQFTISIEMFHAGHLRDLPGILGNDRFSGALIANTVEADDRFLAEARLPFPVVLIGRRVPGCASVVENPETGREAARLLIESGCRRCAVLSPRLGTQASQNRVSEFTAAVAAAGLPPVIEVGCVDRSESMGYAATRALLGQRIRIDGFFAVNDTLAIGAYHAVREAGLTIPKDICFVGVGDSDAAPYLAPPLTCVGSSEDVLHAEAARLLLRCFAGQDVGQAPVQLLLQISLRGSTRVQPKS